MTKHTETGHHWEELLASYVLDALEPAERAEVEAHLAACESCRREADELREATALLAHAAPPRTPPPALRERVLAEARAVRPIATARPRAARRLGPWLAAAASVLLAAVTGWEYLRAREDRDALRRAYAEAQAELAQRDSLLAALLSPQVRTVRLSATGADPAVRLFWNRERSLLMLTAAELEPAPAGRTYQLWGIAPGAAPVSLGTFNTDEDGTARLAVQLPAGLALAVSAITEEPSGGSPQPTTTPFLVGEWESGA